MKFTTEAADMESIELADKIKKTYLKSPDVIKGE